MAKPKIVVVGSLNMDVVVEVSRVPQLGETISGQKAHFIPGGKGANQAVAVARLGAATSMLGAVGQDGFGETLLQTMGKEGISTDTIKIVPDEATGLASILLVHQDNQIIVVPGANGQYLPEDLAQHEELFAQTDVVLLQLETPLGTVIAAAKMAKKYDKMVILNPAPAQTLPPELLELVDYITPNRSELALLSGMEAEGDQLQQAMEAMIALGPSNVVTTLGSAGVAYLSQGQGLRTVPAFKVQVVDTTGAGDSFNGGLAYSLAEGQDLDSAVQFASRVAALAVTKLGAQGGMPTLDEVATAKLDSVG